MNDRWHIAQLNVGRLVAPKGDPNGLSRLWYLERFGPSPHAFTFMARFPTPDRAATPIDMQPDPWCVGRA